MKNLILVGASGYGRDIAERVMQLPDYGINIIIKGFLVHKKEYIHSLDDYPNYPPIIGMVENMAYIKCPDCGQKITVFGDGHFADEVKRHGLELLAEIPIDPELASKVDRGEIEEYKTNVMDALVDKLLK